MRDDIIYSDHMNLVEEWISPLTDDTHNLIMTNKDKTERVVVRRYPGLRSSEIIRLIINDIRVYSRKKMKLVHRTSLEDGRYKYEFEKGVFFPIKITYVCPKCYPMRVGDKYYVGIEFFN